MKKCEKCSKGYLMGGTRKLLRGWYNPTNKSRKQPNLQWARIPGKPGRVKLCVKCLRSIKNPPVAKVKTVQPAKPRKTITKSSNKKSAKK